MNLKDPPKIEPATVKNILLIRLRRIGDIVMTTPALSILRENFPNAHISYITEEPFRELIEGHQDIDETIVISRHPGRKEIIRHIQNIRKQKYDVVIDFHGGPRAFLFTLLSGADLKIGYRIKYKHFFYDIKIPRKPEQGFIHSVENHINMVKALGISSLTIPAIQLPAAHLDEKQKINQFLKKNKLDKASVLTLHIGAGNRFRDWGLQNLHKLIQLLITDPHTAIILTGAKEDLEYEQKLLQKLPAKPVFSLVNRLILRELKELISRAALFIGPDSGPMHIASSTSTAIVAYFGPTLPANFAPWKAKATIIEKDFDCRPCKQVKCIYNDYRCLQTITPEEVYEACRETLGGILGVKDSSEILNN